MSFMKNIVVYRIGQDWEMPDTAKLEGLMEKAAYEPCGATQELSKGWVAPRGQEFGALLETVSGQYIFCLKVEKKAVPASAIKQELDVMAAEYEKVHGRKLKGKMKKEAKEEIKLRLLPHAFSKITSHMVWLDAENRTLVVAASSHKSAESAVGMIVELMAEAGAVLPIAQLNTEQSPQTAMANWLIGQDAPGSFHLGRDVELKQPTEKSSIRYAKHSLALAEIAQHIAEGKLPSKLALEWDGVISFVLTDNFVLSKLTSMEGTDAPSDDGDDPFDANVALFVGSMSSLIEELIEAMGGEADPA